MVHTPTAGNDTGDDADNDADNDAAGPGAEPGQEPQPAPSTPLAEVLSRAISPAPWWRRWPDPVARWNRPPPSGRRAGGSPQPPGGRRTRLLFPVVGSLGVVLLLSLIGIAAPWNAATAPAQGDGRFDVGPALRSPSPGVGHPDLAPGRAQGGQSGSAGGDAAGAPGPPCAPPLVVVTAPEIAGLVLELAGSLASGTCPRVEVSGQESAATVRTLTNLGNAAPDVWIPASSLWLRLAPSGDGAAFPPSGTSVARSPVVLAVPPPVAEDLADQGAWPVWLVFHDQVTSGAIPRMSMADLDTTAGALALVSFAAAVEYHWGSDGEAATFLRTIHFRDSLAANDADPATLLDQLASTSPAESATRVGVFPVTEQQLLAHQERGPATRPVPYGTHEAMSEADYPLVVSQWLDDRLAAIADDLRAQLLSPAAVQRLVEEGFRLPRGAAVHPAALDDTSRFPPYPGPVPLPTAADWQYIVEGWTWNG